MPHDALSSDAPNAAVPRRTLKLALLFGTPVLERAAYYTLLAILVLYMNERLGLSPGESEQFYEGFTWQVYLAPLVAGVLADRWLGAQRTAFAGLVLMAVGALLLVLDQRAAFVGALSLFALGAGFYKPSFYAVLGAALPQAGLRRYLGFLGLNLTVEAGAIGAPLLAGVLRSRVGWAAVFVAVALLAAGAAALLACARTTPARISALPPPLLSVPRLVVVLAVFALFQLAGQGYEQHWPPGGLDRTLFALKAITGLVLPWMVLLIGLWAGRRVARGRVRLAPPAARLQAGLFVLLAVAVSLPRLLGLLHPAWDRWPGADHIAFAGISMLAAPVSYVLLLDAMPRWPATVMGLYVFSTALANRAAPLVLPHLDRWPPIAVPLGMGAMLLGAAGVLLFVSRPPRAGCGAPQGMAASGPIESLG